MSHNHRSTPRHSSRNEIMKKADIFFYFFFLLLDGFLLSSRRLLVSNILLVFHLEMLLPYRYSVAFVAVTTRWQWCVVSSSSSKTDGGRLSVDTWSSGWLRGVSSPQSEFRLHRLTVWPAHRIGFSDSTSRRSSLRFGPWWFHPLSWTTLWQPPLPSYRRLLQVQYSLSPW